MCAGFPGLQIPGLRPAGRDAAAAAGGGAARQRGRNGAPAVRVRLIQINLRALLQLAVVAFLVYQVQAQPVLTRGRGSSLDVPALDRSSEHV